MNKLKKVLKRKVLAIQVALVLLVVLIAVPVMAQRFQELTAKITKTGKIERLSENDELDIIGAVTMSGATRTPVKVNFAVLSGLTGTIVPTSAGWTITAAHLAAYDVFLVDPSNSAVSPYSQGPYGNGYASAGGYQTSLLSGVTVVLTDALTSTSANISNRFIYASAGNTAFYLYDANGRFNGGAGTTNYTGTGTGAAYVMDANGDSCEIFAVLAPTANSGFYVPNIHVE